MKRVFLPKKPVFSDLGIITAVFLLASLVLYGYYAFFTEGGMETVFRNWDGPGYVVVAKTFYNVDAVTRVNPFPFLSADRYAYQLPLYPLFIRAFSFMGYMQSMIFVSQLFSLLFLYAFYALLKKINPTAHALIVTLLLIFYTPRWFIISHVGSSEPVFLFFTTLFLLFFLEKKYLLSGVCAGLVQMTRVIGFVFFIGVSVYFFYEIAVAGKRTFVRGIQEFLPFLLIPLSLIGVFTVYAVQYGNFFSYFQPNGPHILFEWPLLKTLIIPAGIFEIWKESYVFNYILYLIPVFVFMRKRLYFLTILSLVYYMPILSINFMDIARYMLPLLPFAFLAYSDSLSTKSVYVPLFLCIPMVFLFAIGYINMNLAPLPYM